jgi:hypothetical protein
MADPDHFEHVGSRGFHRPVGVVSFEQAIEIVAVGIERAQQLGLEDMLVNVHGLTGFAVPTTFGRYAFAVRWAQAAGGALRVAVVSRPEFIDHEKIGMVMARNRGLDADVFTNEADAITWLGARAVVRR